MKTFKNLLIIFLLLSTSLISQEIGSWRYSFDLSPQGYFVGSAGATVGNKFYIGLGYNRGNDFWSYDLCTGIWTQLSDFPGESRLFTVSFAIGNKIYVGTGATNDGWVSKSDLWEFDTETNTWTQKADVPVNCTNGAGRFFAVGFSINGKGYIGLGASGMELNCPYYNDFYEYDPRSDSWTAIAQFPGRYRVSSMGFSIGDKGYVCAGQDEGASEYGDDLNDLWEYSPSTNTWTQKASLPYEARRWGAVGFSIGNKGYIATGGHGLGDGTYIIQSDCWEYNQSNDVWSRIADFAGSVRQYGVGFSINGKGYVGAGWGSEIYLDFWEFEPGITVNPEFTVTGESPRTIYLGYGPQSVTLEAVGGSTYSWSSNPSGFNSTLQNPVVSPMVTTTYTVNITDACGNTYAKSVTIDVVDWRCGDDNQKVTMCHNGRTICVALSAVESHLNHGDSPGICMNPKENANNFDGSVDDYKETELFNLLQSTPNPFTENTSIEFRLLQDLDITLDIYDEAGKLVKQIASGLFKKGTHQLIFNPENISSGNYIAVLKSNGFSKTINLKFEK